MKKQVIVLIVLVSISIMAVVPASFGEINMKWISLQDLNDTDGNELGDRDVYGYFMDAGDDKVFIECDPDTGEPVGRAYYSTEAIETTTEDIIVDYEYTKTEDWDQVNRADPLEITVMAPNILSDLGWDWDYYNQTGEMRRLAKGPVTWPGAIEAYMIPGSDPDYWLIVAKVTNPNPFSVNAEIYVSIDDWREGFASWDDVQSLTKTVDNVPLEPNETKFVLINRGKKDNYLGDDIDWRNPASMEAWSEAFFHVRVTKNQDPQLPEYLMPNKGYIDFENSGWGPPKPQDLSGGYRLYYQVECRPYSDNYWRFEGIVSLNQNGWIASPRESECVNLDLAKQNVEAFFSQLSFDEVPHVDDDDSEIIDGIKFYRCELGAGSAYSKTGPFRNCFDAAGPVLHDYTTERDLNLDADIVWSGDEEDMWEVGWNDGIPVLEKRPVFLEFFRFEPNDSAEIGSLVKEIVPGYNIEAEEIDRPYFQIEDEYLNYNLEEIENGNYDYFIISVNHHVKVQANNPEGDVRAIFENVRLSLPNAKYAYNELDNYLENWLDADVDVYSDYDDEDDNPVLCDLGTVSIGPGQTKTVFEGNVTTEYKVDDVAISDDYDGKGYWKDYRVWVRPNHIEEAMNEIAPAYFNFNGEPSFLHSARFVLDTMDSGILTFCQGVIKAEESDGDKDYDDLGIVEGKWLEPMSYFNGEGLSMRAGDELWGILQSRKQLSARIYDDSLAGKFWPIMWSHNDYWGFSLDYTNLDRIREEYFD